MEYIAKEFRDKFYHEGRCTGGPRSAGTINNLAYEFAFQEIMECFVGDRVEAFRMFCEGLTDGVARGVISDWGCVPKLLLAPKDVDYCFRLFGG